MTERNKQKSTKSTYSLRVSWANRQTDEILQVRKNKVIFFCFSCSTRVCANFQSSDFFRDRRWMRQNIHVRERIPFVCQLQTNYYRHKVSSRKLCCLCLGIVEWQWRWRRQSTAEIHSQLILVGETLWVAQFSISKHLMIWHAKFINCSRIFSRSNTTNIEWQQQQTPICDKITCRIGEGKHLTPNEKCPNETISEKSTKSACLFLQRIRTSLACDSLPFLCRSVCVNENVRYFGWPKKLVRLINCFDIIFT